jgi:hypothetical protein
VIIEALVHCENNNVKFITYYKLRELASQRIREFDKIYRLLNPDKYYPRPSLSHREFEDIIQDYTKFLRRRKIVIIKNGKEKTESRIYVKFVAIKQKIQNIQKNNSKKENKLTVHFLPKKYRFLFDSVKREAHKTRPLPSESVPVSDSVQIKVTKVKEN